MAVSMIPNMSHSSCYWMLHSWLTKFEVLCLNQLGRINTCTYVRIYMHAASGVVSWSMELLAFASRLLQKWWTIYYICLSFQSILVSEPPATRRVLYTHKYYFIGAPSSRTYRQRCDTLTSTLCIASDPHLRALYKSLADACTSYTSCSFADSLAIWITRYHNRKISIKYT